MTNDPDWERLARYCAGEASSVEEEDLLAWAAADPRHREVVDTALQAWIAAGNAGREWDSEAAWLRVQRRMDPRGQAPERQPASRRPRRTGVGSGPGAFQSWALAAGVAAVLASGLTGVGFWAARRSGSETVAIQELITRKAERAKIRLSDGTEVVIGPESRLTVSARFGDSAREVELTGEAYFDVVSDLSRPFLVSAGETITEVRGTEFGVRAYASDSAVQVVVAEGEVAFGHAGAVSTRLSPGELGELVAGSDRVARRAVDLDSYLGWRDGRLAFEDAPLSQIVAQLERWYGTPVRIGDVSLRNRRLTASFRGESVEEVIAVIAASLGLEYAKVGQVYTFFPKGRSAVLANS